MLSWSSWRHFESPTNTSVQNVSGSPLILKDFYSAPTVKKVLTTATAKTDASIQNRLSRLLESFSFLPISDPTARFRRALRNKRFSVACDPTRTEVDERARAFSPASASLRPWSRRATPALVFAAAREALP